MHGHGLHLRHRNQEHINCATLVSTSGSSIVVTATCVFFDRYSYISLLEDFFSYYLRLSQLLH